MVTKEQIEHLLPMTWFTTKEQQEDLEKAFLELVNSDSLLYAYNRNLIEGNLYIFYLLFFKGYLVNRNKIRTKTWEIMQLC